MSTSRCHRVKCQTKERAEAVIFIMSQRGIGPLYPEFCGICRSWHAVRGVQKKQNGHDNQAIGSTEIDYKSRASGDS